MEPSLKFTASLAPLALVIDLEKNNLFLSTFTHTQIRSSVFIWDLLLLLTFDRLEEMSRCEIVVCGMDIKTRLSVDPHHRGGVFA